MTQTVSAQDARNKFSEILNIAVYGKTKVVITRFNKPQAVLIDYKEYEQLMNPKSRFSDEEWENGFKVFDQIRAKTINIPFQKIKKGVDKAVKEIRSKKRVQSGR